MSFITVTTENQNRDTTMGRFSNRIQRALVVAAGMMGIVVDNALADDALWRALEDGGKVVLIRHAPVERGAAAGDPLLRDPSCRKERNLSETGRRYATLLGRRFKQHEVPIAEVLHSPYCRTTDTARIAFGDAQSVSYLSLLEVLDPDEATARTETLARVIGEFRAEGNLVLITHEPNIRAVSFELMKHLDALVIAPQGDDYEELGVLRFSASGP
jgi:phosphohistidine phosphatase SixA